MDGFPNYSIFANAIAVRNMLILQLTAIVIFCLVSGYSVNRLFNREWQWRAISYLAAGVYYASLALVVVYWFAHPEIR